MLQCHPEIFEITNMEFLNDFWTEIDSEPEPIQMITRSTAYWERVQLRKLLFESKGVIDLDVWYDHMNGLRRPGGCLKNGSHA